ncbi:MAG: hypothetical protein C6P36_11615 [Geobacillus sp.]|nr:MAG: hypothetical protein C6P36_11615 [Geobacillus sp.]
MECNNYHVPVAQLDRATSNTSSNWLRVASTHPASWAQLAEEEAANQKWSVIIIMSQQLSWIEQQAIPHRIGCELPRRIQLLRIKLAEEEAANQKWSVILLCPSSSAG